MGTSVKSLINTEIVCILTEKTLLVVRTTEEL